MADEATRKTIEEIRKVSERLMDPEFALRVFEFDWDAKIVIDEDAKIQFVNNQAEILFGYTRNDLYDKHVNILVPQSVKDIHLKHLENYFKQPRVRPMGGFKGRHKSGSEFDALIYLLPIMWHKGLLVVATVKTK